MPRYILQPKMYAAHSAVIRSWSDEPSIIETAPVADLIGLGKG